MYEGGGQVHSLRGGGARVSTDAQAACEQGCETAGAAFRAARWGACVHVWARF